MLKGVSHGHDFYIRWGIVFFCLFFSGAIFFVAYPLTKKTVSGIIFTCRIIQLYNE